MFLLHRHLLLDMKRWVTAETNMFSDSDLCAVINLRVRVFILSHLICKTIHLIARKPSQSLTC